MLVLGAGLDQVGCLVDVEGAVTGLGADRIVDGCLQAAGVEHHVGALDRGHVLW